MWILYTIIGVIAVLFLLCIAAVSIVFFGTLYRTPKKNAAKKTTVDTSVLNDNDCIASFREECKKELEWFDSLHPKDASIKAHDGAELHAIVMETEHAKATVLLMHGFLSSPRHDFSLVFRFYREKDSTSLPPINAHLEKAAVISSPLVIKNAMTANAGRNTSAIHTEKICPSSWMVFPWVHRPF